MGIASSKFDKNKLLSAAKKMIRNENETISQFDVTSNIHLILIHLKNEIFYFNEDEKKFIFPEQFSNTYLEKQINEINSLIIQITSPNNLTIRSDFLGIKYIYYTTKNDELVFATELKAIIDYYPKDFFTVEEDLILEYTIFRSHWGSNTYYEHIHMLQPRELLEYNLNSNDIHCKYFEKYPSGFQIEDPLETIHKLFTNFFQNLNTNGKNVHWLSGGLDSRLILAYLVENEIPLDMIINFGDKKSKEYKLAHKIIEHYNLQNIVSHYLITPDLIVPEAINHIWRTEGNSSHLNAHIPFMLKQISGDLVIYDGYAGDVVLGGNHWSKTQKDIGDYRNYFRMKLFKQALTPEFFGKLSTYQSKEYLRIKKTIPNVEDDFLLQYKEIIYHENYVRRIARTGGVKIGEDFGVVHYPFMIKDIYNTCIQTPVNERKDHKMYKTYIQKFFPDISSIPSTSLAKKKSKTSTLFAKMLAKAKIVFIGIFEYIFKIKIKKQSSYVDPDEWLRNDEAYRNLITSVLTSEYTAKRGYFDVENISEMIDQHLKRKHNFGLLFAKLFDLEIAYRLFLDHLPPESCLNLTKTSE